MGLDIYPGGAHWAYSGFGSFRRELWNLCGFEGDLYKLYQEKFHEQAAGHSLWPLFNHSDCDGVFTPGECEQMLPVLYELGPKLKEGYDRVQCARLIAGMEECVERKMPMEFR